MIRDFIVIGDEAWLPEELDAAQRRRERERAYRARPDIKAHRAAYHRAWAERNREHLREYSREYMRRWRARAA